MVFLVRFQISSRICRKAGKASDPGRSAAVKVVFQFTIETADHVELVRVLEKVSPANALKYRVIKSFLLK